MILIILTYKRFRFIHLSFTGERCPVVGRVSMDAITVRVSSEPNSREMFTLMTADLDSQTSATGIASQVDTISNDVVIRLSHRVPKYYTSSRIGNYVMKLDNCEIKLP